MGNALRRRRHWKERFDPAAPFIFCRATRIGGEMRGIGSLVPPETAVRSLKKMWRAGRIVRADFEVPNVVTGQPEGEASQHDQLVAATRGLDPSDESLYTSDGKPLTDVLEAIVGFKVTAAARNAAFREAREG